MLTADPNQSHISEPNAPKSGAVLQFPSPDFASLSRGVAANGGSDSPSLHSLGDRAAEFHDGSTFSALESLVARYVPRPGYSRKQLRDEIQALHDAFNICHFELLRTGLSERETAAALYEINRHLLTRIAEVRELMKGLCPYCDWTPCQFDCKPVPDFGTLQAYQAGNE